MHKDGQGKSVEKEVGSKGERLGKYVADEAEKMMSWRLTGSVLWSRIVNLEYNISALVAHSTRSSVC
jgi:hypothetical protein